ncbi:MULTISPECIES: hypothetical protein [unclassified Nocardia]|uniref:hypothetical protein n=1 Tax=unclassified Nocardia TaxID=2637762 RepID=UPI001CE40C5B|nr:MULTISPECIES: hypothetical protein [unclassified Nocardia]
MTAVATTVTSAAAVDGPVAAKLRDGLTALRPGSGWAEEFADFPESGEYWVVDALDGAVQFLQGLPQWCTMRRGRRMWTVSSSDRPVWFRSPYALSHRCETACAISPFRRVSFTGCIANGY